MSGADRFDSPELPPSVRFLVAEATQMIGDGPIGEPSPLLLERLDQAYDTIEPWAARAPELAALGMRLLDRRELPATRRQGCVWLTLYPTEDSIAALAAIARSPEEPRDVRDQAAWSLGFRQAQRRHPSARWTDAVVARADAALLEVVREQAARGKVTLEMLPEALRHVDAPDVLDELARSPSLWGGALEAFATPTLARAALERLGELGEHTPRTIRLVAATLGEEAAPRLVELADEADVGQKLELLFAALPFAPRLARPRLDAALADLARADPFRARAAWHEENPGVMPTVRALRTARTTARLAPEARAEACARAADDLAVLARWVPYAEGYLYDLWSWMVHGAGDPVRLRALVAVDPTRAGGRNKRLHLRDLVTRGRARRAAIAAHEGKLTGEAAWLLATHGRPFAALDVADKHHDASAEALAGRAVAAWLAGRPDLARALLASEAPAPAPTRDAPRDFPGPDELWRAERDPDERPALTALVRAHLAHPADPDARARAALRALLDHARGAPPDADPDVPDLSLLSELEARVRRDVSGRTVYLAGDFDGSERADLVRALEAQGARVVAGPFPGTDYYVLASACDVATVAKLDRIGARRLHRVEAP